MTFSKRLWDRARAVQSLLCVGIDPDPSRFPEDILQTSDPLWTFCQRLVDETAPYAMAFKPQIAYFAALRAEATLERLCAYIHEHHPAIPIILDAKRGDIGSTAKRYAQEAFERYCADAVTLSPFMGFDTIEPFMEYADKGIFLLCRTSNPGGSDLQALTVDGEPLYKRLARLCETTWNKTGELGIVVGATYPKELHEIREVAPTIPFLVPGIGAQGGTVADVLANGTRTDGLGVILNVGRSIMYPKTGTQREAAQAFQAQSALAFKA